MYVAVDIGGTKTDIGFFKSTDKESLIELVTIKTEQDYNTGRSNIIKEISKHKNDEIISISISIAGIVNNNEIILVSNIPDYNNKPLQKELEKEFNAQIFIVQDSICSAIAEIAYGKINNYKRIVHLILGTGLGGSLIINDDNSTSITPIEPCGMIVEKDGRSHNFNTTKGLLEAYVGGGNIQQFFNIDLKNVSDDEKIWDEITDYLVIGINNINCLLKPEIVIIGGGLGSKRKKALESIKNKIKKYNEFIKPCDVDFTTINGNSSLFGALAINITKNIVINN